MSSIMTTARSSSEPTEKESTVESTDVPEVPIGSEEQITAHSAEMTRESTLDTAETSSITSPTGTGEIGKGQTLTSTMRAINTTV